MPYLYSLAWTNHRIGLAVYSDWAASASFSLY